MARVKETGMNPNAAAAAARAAEKTARLEAGQALTTEMVKQMAKERAELKKEQMEQETKNNTSPDKAGNKKDTSRLSGQSKWFGIEGKLLKNANIKWTLEMEKELWAAIQQWFPAPGQELSSQIEELSRLYLALLEAILTHTMGEEQTVQLERLETLLAQKLNMLINTDLKNLIELLENTGQTEDLKLVKASVYKQTTGESLSSGSVDTFYSGKTTAAGRSTRYFMPESSAQGTAHRQGGTGTMFAGTDKVSAGTGEASARVGEGTLYQLGKNGNIHPNQEFNSQSRSGELQMNQRIRVLKGAAGNGIERSNLSGGKGEVTGSALARANAFASHINGTGNLLKNTEISAQNDEVKGLLAAMTTMKGQVYAASEGRNNGITTPLRNAVNQMVDSYFSQKGIYKVYYYTTNAYERTRNPQKALQEGLEYAYKIFTEKKEEPSYRQQPAYSERAGFFQMVLKGQTMEADLIRGMRLLEANWRDFLSSIGEDKKKGITLTMQKHSPWGILTKPDRTRKPSIDRKEKLVLAEAACVAVLVALYLCYRLFFG